MIRGTVHALVKSTPPGIFWLGTRSQEQEDIWRQRLTYVDWPNRRVYDAILHHHQHSRFEEACLYEQDLQLIITLKKWPRRLKMEYIPTGAEEPRKDWELMKVDCMELSTRYKIKTDIDKLRISNKQVIMDIYRRYTPEWDESLNEHFADRLTRFPRAAEYLRRERKEG